MTRAEIINYIELHYSVSAEYLWAGETHAVFRHPQTRKWFGIIMEVKKIALNIPPQSSSAVSDETAILNCSLTRTNANPRKLKFSSESHLEEVKNSHLPLSPSSVSGDEYIDIMNVKANPTYIEDLLHEEGFLPAYHMNKKYWVSIRLDGTVSEDAIKRLIEGSYSAVSPKKSVRNNHQKEISEMTRPENVTIKSIDTLSEKYLQSSLDLIEKVFTEHADENEGKTVRSLVEEIRAKKYYIPELELLMLAESSGTSGFETDATDGDVIGYVMFSRFHIEGRYEDELLILTPCAVKTEFQRQHISKDLIEAGFERAKKMGFRAVLVEGDPKNYNPRGFEASHRYGITASPKIHLPHPDCLMIKELADGALKNIHGVVDYSFYKTLSEE